MSVKIKNKTKSKVFTRITLDDVSLKAVERVKSSIQNYDVNDAVKFIIGLGIGQLDSVFPKVDENGFNEVTAQKIKDAIDDVESGNGVKFDSVEDLMKYLDN